MQETNIIYHYDGSFDGCICCVFDAFYRRENPMKILSKEERQVTLFPVHEVQTDFFHAKRVLNALYEKVSPKVVRFIEEGFLSCEPEKEKLILETIRRAFRDGANVLNNLTDDSVGKLYRAVKFLKNETHLLCGFVRFSEQNHILCAVISPKNRVLPLLAPHFCRRYPEEHFLIYDKTHQEAVIYQPYESILIPLENFQAFPADEEEKNFRALWKCFYDTIAIEGRLNPKCRMNHMPKRYWSHLTELQEQTENFNDENSEKTLSLKKISES